ncbi:hypothetical protein EMIHUDRAFT_215224 [Emiliania huxleyi CCMP1516]|uniref:Sel1 repeat family protein n=2 Tax=Emiliania huxleyi TaxID=2903 RepID=A0A0D3II37_EMIH1|nr:hypothetical protein EMIHUDRAFT_215224 [Emiliania huxleyi CCMP1516]EOD10922.1 hypothetical protein EMIHUDRAFT_215224 [Emiliania huxleyi CCMP1516]|eukprot:XP_005763351.1 hypothetical protein EMIHUDRAFT_215224 [Emiliania huxleyi CCMP1516]
MRFGRGRMAIIASGAALGQKVACDGNNPEEHDDSARRSSDPPPPDDAERRTLIARWTTENEIPNTSWPPRREGAEAGCRPALRRAFDACGGEQRLFAAKSGGWVAKRHHECDEITFQLAVSLLGGACAWAFLLRNGDVVEEDSAKALHYHHQAHALYAVGPLSWDAASAGYAQSMHEIGTMHYLGDGVEPDSDEAGTKQDTASALGWFAAAGELGHCSARSRIVAEGFGGLPACIYERLEEV